LAVIMYLASITSTTNMTNTLNALIIENSFRTFAALNNRHFYIFWQRHSFIRRASWQASRLHQEK